MYYSYIWMQSYVYDTYASDTVPNTVLNPIGMYVYRELVRYWYVHMYARIDGSSAQQNGKKQASLCSGTELQGQEESCELLSRQNNLRGFLVQRIVFFSGQPSVVEGVFVRW